MNVVVESLPNCLATLRVEVEPEKVSETRERVARDFGQQARIPGYRQGKAPRAVVERKFKKQIREELERTLLTETTRQAISEKGLRVLQLANIEDVQIGDDNRMSYTATVVTQPEFGLPEYKGLRIEVPIVEVSDADVDASLDHLREQAADFVDIEEDRGAQMEDYVVVDYTGTIDGKPVHELFPKAGKPLSGNDDFWIKMTDEAFFPGFCAALLDTRAGESREFTIEVPADFPVEGMPGQKIDYKVTVKEIKKKILPSLDDAFANTIVEGRTLEQLREIGRDELLVQRRAAVENSKRSQIMRHLTSWVECELPTNLVRQQTQRILSDIVRENMERGVADEVLRESEKELVGAAANSAREKLKGTFILLRIAEKEGLRVTREELFGRVAALAERYRMGFDKMLKELEKRGALDQVQEEIVTGKVLEFLVSNASVVEVPANLPGSSTEPEAAATSEAGA